MGQRPWFQVLRDVRELWSERGRGVYDTFRDGSSEDEGEVIQRYEQVPGKNNESKPTVDIIYRISAGYVCLYI